MVRMPGVDKASQQSRCSPECTPCRKCQCLDVDRLPPMCWRTAQFDCGVSDVCGVVAMAHRQALPTLQLLGFVPPPPLRWYPHHYHPSMPPRGLQSAGPYGPGPDALVAANLEGDGRGRNVTFEWEDKERKEKWDTKFKSPGLSQSQHKKKDFYLTQILIEYEKSLLLLAKSMWILECKKPTIVYVCHPIWVCCVPFPLLHFLCTSFISGPTLGGIARCCGSTWMTLDDDGAWERSGCLAEIELQKFRRMFNEYKNPPPPYPMPSASSVWVVPSAVPPPPPPAPPPPPLEHPPNCHVHWGPPPLLLHLRKGQLCRVDCGQQQIFLGAERRRPPPVRLQFKWGIFKMGQFSMFFPLPHPPIY